MMRIMKRIDMRAIQFVLSAALMLTMGTSVFAAAPAASSQSIQTVQSLEDTLYAVHYDQDTIEARLSRLEETVFGQAQTGQPIDARINKLKTSLSPASLGPLSAKAKPTETPAAPKNTNTTNPAKSGKPTTASKPVVTPPANTGWTPTAQQPSGDSSWNTPQQTAQETSPLPGETDYPAVSIMEKKIFGTTYLKDDITQRLTRLEKQVFKTVQSGSLADRVDNLRMVVLGDVDSDNSTIASNSGASYNYPNSGGSYSSDPYASDPTAGGYGRRGSRHQRGQYPSDPYGTSSYNGNYSGNGSGYGNGSGTYYQNSGSEANNYGSPTSYGGNTSPYGGGYGAGNAASANGQVTPDMLSAMDEVEKEVLGHTYASEPITTRLDRVETKIFNTTSPEMAPEERMQRVIAVASAGGAPQSTRAKAKTTFQTLLPIILTILPMVLL